MTKALAYLRTSSATNVGGDSDVRQRTAIQSYAKAHGIEVIAEYYDAAVSGADAVQDRPGFGQMLDHIEGNGVRLILVEDASRFARDIMVQEAGIAMLAAREVKLIACNTGDDMTDSSDPMRKMLRIIVGAVMAAEKDRLVAKMKAARDRKSAELGFTVQSHYAKYRPEIFAVLRGMKAEGLTLVGMSEALEAQGFLTKSGKRIAPEQVRRLLMQLAEAA